MKYKQWMVVAFLIGSVTASWGQPIPEGPMRVRFTKLGSIPLSGYPRGLLIEGNTAFVAQQSEQLFTLAAFDISDRQTPSLVGKYERTGSASLEAVRGDTAYLLSEKSIILLDISDPSSPQVISTYESQVFDGSTFVAKMLLIENTLLLIAHGNPLLSPAVEVLDISNPHEPRFVSTYAESRLESLSGGFVVVGSHLWMSGSLYRGDVTSPYIYRLVGVSFQDPAQPVPLGSVDLGRCGSGYGSLLHAKDDHLYVLYSVNAFGGDECGIGVADISDPESPALRTCLSFDYWSAWTWNSIATGESPFLYCLRSTWVMGGTYLAVLDVGTLTRPNIVFASYMGGTQVKLAVADDLLAVASGGGFVIGDIVEETPVLCLIQITELPAIIRQFIQNGKLNLQWNEPARGMKLQRSISLINPDWHSLEGSENRTSVELPVEGGPEYFRLVKPE